MKLYKATIRKPSLGQLKIKTIIVDNFFDDPDSIREFALGLNYYPRRINQFYEGIRSEPLHELDKNLYNKICSKIILEYYGHANYIYEGPIYFHQTRETDKNDEQWIFDKIHRDKAITAGIVYLTPNAPLDCGTQTYEKKGKSFFPDVVMGNRYNRLIAYNANTYHSATNFFGNNNQSRLCMLFFLEKIERII